jgi:hypothetical protein
MTAIAAATSTPAVTTSTVGAASAAAIAAPTLLPAPQEFQSDPLSMLYLFQSQNEQVGMSSGTSKIQGLEKERHADLVKEQAAIAAEVKAAQHKSFWDKLGDICSQVAKVAGVVASIAAAVATCGAATPLAAVAVAGAVLSTAGFISSETNVLQKLGINGSLANILNTAMSAGGAIMSMGAGAAAGAGNIVTTTSAIVSGTGHIGSGVSAIGSGEAQAAEDNAAADQVAAEGGQDNLTRLIAHVLQEVQQSDDQSKQMLSTIGQTKGIENQTALAVASGLKA